MKITLKPKKELYRSFPEYKGKKIKFIGLRREDYSDDGYLVYVDVGSGEYVGELTISYFTLIINK